MCSNAEITLTGSTLNEWLPVLGTDTVPVCPALPREIEEARIAVFSVDVDQLTAEQREHIAKHVSARAGVPVEDVKKNICDAALMLADDCYLRHLSMEHVHTVIRFAKQQGAPSDSISLAYSVALRILRLLLTGRWVDNNIGPSLVRAVPSWDYLRLSLSAGTGQVEHLDRVIDLADSLFLLQECDGFHMKLDKLRESSPRKPEVRLEDTATEFHIAKMIKKRGWSLRFVETTGVKGCDFDLEVSIGGQTVAAEIKCKREETAVSIRGLRKNSLKRIRDQLPRTKPGLAFVRITANWVQDKEFTARADQLIRDFFRRTPYVNVVVFVWEEWKATPHHSKERLLKYRPYFNPSPQYRVDA